MNHELEHTQLISYDPETSLLQTGTVRMEASSPFLLGKKLHLEVGIEELPLRFGKASICALSLSDPYVSREHAELFTNGKQILLADLRSTNGTFINGMRIEAPTPLRQGDQIQVGKTTISFSLITKREKIAAMKEHLQEFEGILSATPRMHQLFYLIEKIAPLKETVLILGETGTGKELVARAIHKQSRCRGQFVAINCGAIASELIESELFGHVKGAFTGADRRRLGAFEVAEGGTLFLDEIGELPLPLQSKLLRAIEYKEIRPVGSDTFRPSNCRSVAATHRDLTADVKEGRFRKDLFYRLYVLPLMIPPLRERREDLPHLIKKFSEGATRSPHFSDTALHILKNHSWPGNVRELKNVVTRTLFLSEKDEIGPGDIAFIESTEQAPPDSRNLDAIECFHIQKALLRNNWNKKKAAEELGIANSTLHDKIKRFGLKK